MSVENIKFVALDAENPGLNENKTFHSEELNFEQPTLISASVSLTATLVSAVAATGYSSIRAYISDYTIEENNQRRNVPTETFPTSLFRIPNVVSVRFALTIDNSEAGATASILGIAYAL